MRENASIQGGEVPLGSDPPGKTGRGSEYAGILLVVALMVSTGLMGAWVLRDVPGVGVGVSASRAGVRVVSVDEDGPAAGQIEPGEYIRSIGDMELNQADLYRYPAFWSPCAERAWWQRQERIYKLVKSNSRIAFEVVSSDQGARTVWLTGRKRTWGSILQRGVPVYASGIALVLMGMVVSSKGRQPARRIVQVFCVAMGIYHMSIAPILMKELVLSPGLRHLLSGVSYGAVSATIVMAHWALLFPRRKRVVETHPLLAAIPYAYIVIMTGLNWGGALGFGSAVLGLYLWPAVFVGSAVHSYWSEEDVLQRQQILLFLMIPVMIVVFFTLYMVVPGKLWVKALDYPFFAMITVVFGYSVLLAVENQRIFTQSVEREHFNLRDRAQMAREMHDNFGNALAGIVRLCDRGEGEGNPDGGGGFVQIKRVAQNALAEARNFIAAVDPLSSRWEDYLVQCRQQALDIVATGGVHLEYHSNVSFEPGYVRPPVQYHLSGIIREALNNVVKHAGARQVRMRLDILAGRGELQIEDDGVGWDGRTVSPGSHGLANMAGRAKEINGDLAVVRLEKGTRLVVKFVP